MIIVSITGPTMQDALAQANASERYADMFEFRLDLIVRPNIAALLASTRKPTIVACRPVWEGGGFSGTERERISMLELASVFGATYVDIELNANPRIVNDFISRQNETKVIASLHLLDGSLFDVRRVYQALHNTGADVIKLAFEVEDAYENRLAFDFLSRARKDKQKAIAVAIGEAGEASRILYKKFGGWATYASSELGGSAASGQISASILKRLYRADKLSPSTKVYGVVGNPIRQSKGVFIHNPLFQAARLNAVYSRFKVENLELFIRRIVPEMQGFSVTIPHKQNIMKYVDQIDSTAKGIGAVNTVVRRGSTLKATNTDAVGALDAIENVVSVKGKRMLILGAGGAARAIAYEAKRRGAHVMISSRNDGKARRLAADFGLEFVKRNNADNAEFDILVNATPVGMTPHDHESPVPKSMLKRKVVFDAVYNPPLTRLLRDAKSVGAKTIPGTEMYLNQAALQSKLYTGRKPNTKLIRKLLQ